MTEPKETPMRRLPVVHADGTFTVTLRFTPVPGATIDPAMYFAHIEKWIRDNGVQVATVRCGGRQWEEVYRYDDSLGPPWISRTDSAFFEVSFVGRNIRGDWKNWVVLILAVLQKEEPRVVGQPVVPDDGSSDGTEDHPSEP